ncbi:hypothetical protein QOZ80_8BG0643420 [Eleusine coracana subsp. coracana]|nr:hypothetical protein QOZ80_8BG0643420 [Eleusine coracana subsp. coracana]
MALINNLAPCFVFRPTNKQAIALLPSLFAGGEGSPFVHRADLYSAAPADVVHDLLPAQGTDVWYLLCRKKYKSDGRRRLRAVAGGKECWRGEAGGKDVEVVLDDGSRIVGCFRTFSYGYKTPAKQFKRLGWCMVEYALKDACYGHVLCKVYLSPRANASSSNSAVLPSSNTQVTHDPLMTMPVQVQHGMAQSSYFHDQGWQPGTGGLVHRGDTCRFMTSEYENLLTYDALIMVSAPPVQHSVGRQGLDDGLVLGGGDPAGPFSAGLDVEELLTELDLTNYDPHVFQVAGATWGTPPPDDHFFDGLPFGL